MLQKVGLDQDRSGVAEEIPVSLVTLTMKLFLLMLLNCKFADVVNHNVNIFGARGLWTGGAEAKAGEQVAANLCRI